MCRRPALSILFAPVTVWLAVSGVCACAEEGSPHAGDAARQLDSLLSELKSGDQDARALAFQAIMGRGSAAVKAAHAVIEKDLAANEKRYAAILEPRIRAAYLERLSKITDAQLTHVLKTRMMWKRYILRGGQHKNFPRVFLKPIWDMKKILLFDVREIGDPEILSQRKRLEEFAAYQARCHRTLGISPDPTVGKLSPTKIKYAPLDKPPTFMDNLHHYERTLVLINTVASEGARKVLLVCDRAAREIDVQEAEFVMFVNEVRMLAGSIAWRTDPLGCAVARDHSNDRRKGLAKGHMSDVPGKRRFPDRNKRMGAAFFQGEGVGGGRNGRAYANGLSYSGDGHGWPLYSVRGRRNCVGVGRRGGAYTSMYRFVKSITHPCPATENEMWMPPGIAAKDIRNPMLANAYRAMKTEMVGEAAKLVERAEPTTDLDKIMVRFLRVAIEARTAQIIEEMTAVDRSGDVYGLAVLIKKSKAKFGGIERFQKKVALFDKALKVDPRRKELRRGQSYYSVYFAVKGASQRDFDITRPTLIRRLERMARSYKDSPYGEAAAAAATRLKDPKSDASAMLAYFKDQRASGRAHFGEIGQPPEPEPSMK